VRKRINTGTGFIFAAAIMLLFSSCFKEDKKVALSPPGENQVASVEMGLGYKTEEFFSLSKGNILSNQFAAWDMAFESSSSGYHVWINGGKGMYAASMNSNAFYLITDTIGAHWRWDEPSGNPDSTAVGNWVSFIPTASEPKKISLRVDGSDSESKGNVFVIDRGLDYAGDDRFYKVVFESVNEARYKFKYAALDNHYIDSVILQKDQNQNYTYFTFDNGGSPITMEPNRKTWDILFTRYRHIFYDTNPVTPYLVTGVLLNPTGVQAAVDSIQPYENIDYTYARTKHLTTNREVIGYDWKKYSFTTHSYTVLPSYSYIIKDQKGYYWKLRFLDFYDAQNEEGYPKFEYQRL